MAGKGFPAAPAALRILKGNGIDKDCAGKVVNPGPKFDRGAPDPPVDLSDEARLEWNRVVPCLDRLDLLKDTDYAALVEHCELWSAYIAAVRLVRVEGVMVTTSTGTARVNPSLTTMLSLGKELRNSCREFGLTPASEQNLSRAVPRDDDADPFGEVATA